MKSLLISTFLFAALVIHSQDLTFEEISLTGLPNNFSNINSEWADMDQDGDLDVLIHGTNGETISNSVYENNGDNSFTIHTTLPNWTLVDFAWQDYDLDGDGDFVMSGVDENGSPKVRLFELIDNVFSSRDIFVSSFTKTKVQWENINNDIYADLALITISDEEETTTIVNLFENLGNGNFQSITESSVGLGGRNAVEAEIIFSDFDGDNLTDFMFRSQSEIQFFEQTDLNDFSWKRELRLFETFNGPLTLSEINQSGTDYFFFNEGSEFNDPIVQSSPYDTPDQLIEEEIELEDGSYFWFMQDEIGNGFKDPGYAKLTDNNGKVLFEVNANEFFRSQTKTPFCIGSGTHCYASPLRLEILLDEDPEQISWSIFRSDEVMYSLNADQSDFDKTDQPFSGEIFTWSDIDQDNQPDALVRQVDGNWNWTLNKSENWSSSENFAKEGVFHRLLNSPSDQKVSILFTRKNNDLSEWFLIKPSSSQTLSIPSTPTELTATSDVEIVELTWNSSESFATYELKIEKDGVDLILPKSSFAGGFWGGDTSAQLRLLESGNYSISVRAIGANNIKSNYSTSIDISIALPENFNLFDEINSILQNRDGYSALIDIDMDGDLDIFQDGGDCSGRCFSESQLRGFQLLENINGSYVEREQVNFDFEGSQRLLPTPASWIDIDLDGDLDLIMGGRNASGDVETILYENSNWFFSPKEIDLPAIEEGSFVWGDYDNDGDQDVFVTGRAFEGNTISNIYENISGSFKPIDFNFTPLDYEYIQWVDYDDDGFLDISRCGTQSDGEPLTEVYRNANGSWELQDLGLQDVHLGSTTWIDIDMDGDRDLILIGNARFSINPEILNEDGNPIDPIHFSKIYLNNDGAFVEIETEIEGFINNSIATGDLDNDGDFDLAIKGLVFSNDPNIGFPYKEKTAVYINKDGNFSEIDLSLLGQIRGAISLGDIDLDGDLDILSNGFYNESLDTYVDSKLIINNKNIVNEKPSQPTNLKVDGLENAGAAIDLSWDSGGDLETDSPALTYSYRLFKEDVLISNTFQLGGRGIIGFNKSISLHDFTPGDYTVEVYSIDASYNYSDAATIHFKIKDFFQRVRSTDFESTDGSESVVDFNGDGAMDIISYNPDNQNNVMTYNLLANSNTFDFSLESSISITEANQTIFFNWADMNNDSRPDFMVSSTTPSSDMVLGIYSNSENGFSQEPSQIIENALIPVPGDFDNDGDLDMATILPITSELVLFKNKNGLLEKFITLEDDIVLLYMEWIDYDSDNDMDLMVQKQIPEGTGLFFYNNSGGEFVIDEAATISVGSISSQSTADIDSDGDPDLILASTIPENNVRIWINQNGMFTEGEIILDNIRVNGFSQMDWGDYDNDGDLDLFISVQAEDGPSTIILRNKKGILTDIQSEISSINDGSLYLADFDNDQDLDLFASGRDQFEYQANIYENVIEKKNSIPQPPSNLSTEYSSDNLLLYFNWDRGIDNETASVALSYNIKLWNDQGMPIAPAALDDGTLTLIQTGNAGFTPSYKFEGSRLPDGEYVWAVQSIDNGYGGSEFTESTEVLMCFNYFENDLNFVSSGTPSVGNPIKFEFDNPENTVATSIDYGDGMASENTTHIYTTPGTYDVVLTLTSNVGCEYKEAISLEIGESVSSPKITNVITPNGDGRNDFLIVTEARLDRENSLEIFNSAGQSLFKTSNYLNDWDGTYNGSVLPPGQYLAVFINEGVKTNQVFTILR